MRGETARNKGLRIYDMEKKHILACQGGARRRPFLARFNSTFHIIFSLKAKRGNIYPGDACLGSTWPVGMFGH